MHMLKIKELGTPNVFVMRLLLFEVENSPGRRRSILATPRSILVAHAVQRSASSPVLFNVCAQDVINTTDDMAKEQEVERGMFADDVATWTIGVSWMDMAVRLRKATQKIEKWCNACNMMLNPDKCHVIPFTNKKLPKCFPIRVSDATTKTVTTARMLGVWFDSRMTFKEHLKQSNQKMRPRMRQLAALAHSNNGPAAADLHTMHAACVRSATEHAAPAWCPFLSKTSLKKVERWQNKAARLTLGAFRATAIPNLLRQARLCPLEERFKCFTTLAVEKF